MSFPYLPLYTGDYIRDTTDLSPREHGVYLLMLMWCWQRAKPMPNDMLRLCRIARTRDAQDEQAVQHVLKEFFVLGADNCYHNQRLEEELKRSQGYVNRAKKAAQARWKDHPNRMPDGCLEDAKSMLNVCLGDAKSMPPSPSPSPYINHKDAGSPKVSPKERITPLAPRPKNGHEADASPPFIGIPLNDKTEAPITEAMIGEWEALYPNCDVRQTLREIRGWNLANPTKRKTKAGILRHINQWLAKEQNHG